MRRRSPQLPPPRQQRRKVFSFDPHGGTLQWSSPECVKSPDVITGNTHRWSCYPNAGVSVSQSVNWRAAVTTAAISRATLELRYTAQQRVRPCASPVHVTPLFQPQRRGSDRRRADYRPLPVPGPCAAAAVVWCVERSANPLATSRSTTPTAGPVLSVRRGSLPAQAVNLGHIPTI